jgi:hypothetical protein
VALVLPQGPILEPTETWAATADARRCDLIDREIAGTLTPEEAAELHAL